MLFLLTGPSGAGKSSVLDALLTQTELGLSRFVTTTTRAPRPGEQNGVEYWFVTREEFERDLAEGAFYEWADVYGNYYGSSKKEMERLDRAGKPVVFIIDVQGARTLKRLHPETVVIFLDAPKDELIARMKARGMSESDISARAAKIDGEEAYRASADVVVENPHHHLEEAIGQVTEEIRSRIH